LHITTDSLKKFRKILSRIILTIALLIVLLYVALHFSPVQNWLVNQVTSKLSSSLKTTVRIDHVDFSFFNEMKIKGVLIKDLKKDTLLYTKELDVRISDWFFFKDKPILHYIGLKDALINLKRNDSIWNYQFLTDYFSGSADTSSNKKSGTIELDIKKIFLENIQFNQIDTWIGQDMKLGIEKLSLDAEKIDLKNKKINLTSIDIDAPSFFQNDYTGNRDRLNISRREHTQQPEVLEKFQWNNDEWILDVKKITIASGSLQIERETDRAPYKGQFDGDHFTFGSINGKLNNVHFEKDTITSKIILSTKERSGFEVKKLQADLKFTPEEMRFNNLDIFTNNSHLTNFYTMKYKDFIDDMGDFLHNVVLEGNFINSTISSNDLAYFAPELKQWNRKFQVSGIAKGTIDNIYARQMSIKSGNTKVNGTINLIGLPNLDKTFIDFKSNELTTTYGDVVSIVPLLKNIHEINLSKLNNIQFKGNFTGFLNDFVTYGILKTNLGSVQTDLNIKLPETKPMIYKGKIVTSGFDIGQILGNDHLGKISLDANIAGKGISAEDINASIDGNVKGIEFNRYNYQNIAVKGDFIKKIFTGSLNIKDSNIVLDNLTGVINLSKKIPEFKFDASLSKLRTKQLKLTSDEFDLKGEFSLNFTGSNIDNFLGSAKIFNAVLLHDNDPLSFDSVSLQSQILDGKKLLSLQSNEINGEISGDFKILELPGAFQLFLNKYYPAYIAKTSKPLTDQNFNFHVRTNNIDPYIKIFNKKLSGFNDASIEGNLKLRENELNIYADIPSFSYEKKQFRNIIINSKGNLETLSTQINVDDIKINDSLHLPSTKLSIKSHNDTSEVSINTSASQMLGDASLNAMIQTMNNAVKVHFYPSSFIINDKKWEIEKDGELYITNNEVTANEVKIVQGNQQISISTIPSTLGIGNAISIGLNRLNIDEVMPFLFKQPHLEGLVSGEILIEKTFTQPIISSRLNTENFKLDNDSIGLLYSRGNYNTATGKIDFITESDNQQNKFKIDGFINSLDSTDQQTNINFKADNFDLGILNNYLGDIFADIKGKVKTDDLNISGSLQNLSLTGTTEVTDGSLKVKYTQCKYKFGNETIRFKPDEIDFGTLQLKDTLNNTATVSGKIYHKFFRDFSFDKVLVESSKLLVLNTTKKDNSQFYGKVIGKARMRLNGPAENILIDIEGEPSTRDSSHIYIAGGNSIEGADMDYINFVPFGKEMEAVTSKRSTSNVLVNMNLTANPTCKIDVILDETTGDIVKGEGNGLLNIRVGNKEPLSIRGRYDITKGEYTFNFQTFLKKPFTLKSGSITWSGDPYLANINIVAEYLAKNVDFSNISTDLKKKSDIRVVSHLTETLLKPKIGFQFLLPDNSELKNDFVISKRLQEFANDENEMNKQVTSLLLFNSFISNSQSFLNVESGYSVLSNTIGGVVSSALSSSFNRLLQKVLSDNTVSFNVDLNSNLDLQSKVAKLQGAAKASITKGFFNNRLIVTIGGNFDYNNPYAYISTNKNNNVLITPDVTAEWILTKDGRVRLVGFNQTNTDIIGQRNRTGIKLTYKKDTDNLYEIFLSGK
jgi:hypothetical protein